MAHAVGGVINVDDWLVCVSREFVELAGHSIMNDHGGPYVALALFTGPGAEQLARNVVTSMTPLMGDGIWAWSGQDVIDERAERN